MPGELNILPVLCNLVVTGRAIGPEAITGAITEHRMRVPFHVKRTTVRKSLHTQMLLR